MYVRPVDDLQRVTRTTLDVLTVLIRDAANGGEVYGQAIAKEIDTAPNTVYDILGRLEGKSWVTSRREAANPHPERPARRFYTLTPRGRERAELVIQRRRSAAPADRAA